MEAITENLGLFNEAEVMQHLSFLFGRVQWESGQFVCLRGIGEKGSSQEGNFREEFFFEPVGTGDGWKYAIAEHCKRWSQFHVASFIIPCVLSAAKATAENCAVFTALVADFDSGDSNERATYCVEHFGMPSLVIASGGTTDDGAPKMHLWWAIDPTSDVQTYISTRHAIAERCGADLSLGRGVASNPFGRAHQPIRLAGTVHSKNGKSSAVRCLHLDDTVPLMAIAEAQAKAQAMPHAPWATVMPELPVQTQTRTQTSLFSPNAGGGTSTPVDLTTPVYEGGTDRTRFSEFGRVAGHYVHAARRGDMTLDGAFDALNGWVLSAMRPPWPEARVRSEWEAIVRKDAQGKGAFPSAAIPVGTTSVEPITVQPLRLHREEPEFGITDLRESAAHRWATKDVPNHVQLIENLVLKGEPHLFVAEGGVGKTGMLLDLAMKVAAFEDGDQLEWCGQAVKAGGPVLLLLCEDSKTEMHIRLRAIDRDGLIERAGDKLMVLPMSVMGGAFPLSERDHKTGGSTTSARWSAMLNLIRKLPEPPVLVAVDTLNSVSHGDENNNVVIAEMMREAHRVCGEFGAALLFNHHIRKSNEPLRSLEDLRNAIRGASAIPSYFRINFGIFHAGDYERRMRAMSMVPKRGCLYRFGICKANIHGLLRGERTLLRDGNGMLVDVTKADAYAVVNISERLAWLVYAVRVAADSLHPYGMGGKNSPNGLYKRRTELPPILRGVGWKEFGVLVEEALQKGHLVCAAVRGSKSKAYLDVPNGTLASDDAGVVINAGAYTNVPEWEEFRFDEDTGEITMRTRERTWQDTFTNRVIDTQMDLSSPQEDTKEDTL